MMEHVAATSLFWVWCEVDFWCVCTVSDCVSSTHFQGSSMCRFEGCEEFLGASCNQWKSGVFIGQGFSELAEVNADLYQNQYDH